MIFFYEKDSMFNPQLIYKSRFLIQQVPIEKKMGWKLYFAIQHIRDQTNPFACICSFTFHTSYKNGMIGHVGGKLSKCSKTH